MTLLVVQDLVASPAVTSPISLSLTVTSPITWNTTYRAGSSQYNLTFTVLMVTM